jgi:hypothetical protein
MVSLPVLADVLFLCDRRCSCDCSINERVMLSASIACASVGVEICMYTICALRSCGSTDSTYIDAVC